MGAPGARPHTFTRLLNNVRLYPPFSSSVSRSCRSSPSLYVYFHPITDTKLIIRSFSHTQPPSYLTLADLPFVLIPFYRAVYSPISFHLIQTEFLYKYLQNYSRVLNVRISCQPSALTQSSSLFGNLDPAKPGSSPSPHCLHLSGRSIPGPSACLSTSQNMLKIFPEV